MFRIIQEALNNVAKHSKATELYVSISQIGDNLILEIIDNGVGFEENQKKNPDSYGLIGMKERVFLLDGELTISSKKNYGTSVKVMMPYNYKK
jgi:signal transduction histidine kinase